METKTLPKTDYTPAKLDEASTLLLKAAAIIEKHGWCRYDLRNTNGQMCVRGAMHHVLRGNAHAWCDWQWNGGISFPVYDEAVARLNKALEVCDPADWNNNIVQSQDEVVAKLRAVALGW